MCSGRCRLPSLSASGSSTAGTSTRRTASTASAESRGSASGGATRTSRSRSQRSRLGGWWRGCWRPRAWGCCRCWGCSRASSSMPTSSIGRTTEPPTPRWLQSPLPLPPHATAAQRLRCIHLPPQPLRAVSGAAGARRGEGAVRPPAPQALFPREDPVCGLPDGSESFRLGSSRTSQWAVTRVRPRRVCHVVPAQGPARKCKLTQFAQMQCP
mmetsp:Transcript_47482/g.140250  ORF Transcript_47482/g.140250 Transcript_47482/m.140250 type:complete len:212 (+) Transcript_47482:748-1383(+)